jgi:hypothetical protein
MSVTIRALPQEMSFSMKTHIVRNPRHTTKQRNGLVQRGAV